MMNLAHNGSTFQCYLIFDEQREVIPAFRNDLLSTGGWAWYGDVILVRVEGDWPTDYVPPTNLIRHALDYYSTQLPV
jgi:hypothetical protein